jgi:serine phosphatase RsbU (regulator of sigma subunit)
MVLILGAGILVTTFIGARRMVQTMSESLVTRTLDAVDARLRGFFDEPARLLRMTCEQARHGVFELSPERRDVLADDEATFAARRDHRNRLLQPIVERYPQISSLMLNDGPGREHMLLHDGQRWRNRVVDRHVWGSEARWQEWTDDSGDARSHREPSEYNPSIRPWYVGALAARDGAGGPATPATDAVHWTAPYTFFTTKDPGITVSRTYDQGDDIDRAIGFDVLLSDISTFTQGVQISPRGLVAVLTDDRRFIGLPRMEEFMDAETQQSAFLKHPEDFGLSLFHDAMTAQAATGQDLGSILRFQSGGEVWWGQVHPFRLSEDQVLRVAVLVPEADLVVGLQRQRLVIIAIVLVVLILSLLRAAHFARRFSEPVETLVRQSDRISGGDLEPGPPIVSNLTEIQRLASAQDHMREGIRSVIKLEKLERDLDLARDIQRGLLPTEPLSIAGFEVFGWNEPADQTGGDYFDWQQLADGRWVITVADVTGHGVGPALVTAFCRAYSRASLPLVDGLGACLTRLNEQVHQDLPAGRFVTLVVALLGPDGGEMELLSAGHGPLFLYRAATGALESFNAHEIPLGLMPDVTYGAAQPIELKQGDVVVLLTDGFFEWANASGEQFGLRRLEEAIAAEAPGTVEEIVAGLHRRVLEFVGSTPQPDDLTVVVIKRTAS